MKDQRLEDALNAKTRPIYMDSKEQVVDYYKDTFGRGWKQKLVHDLAPIAGVKPKNLERRFDPSRLHSPEKKNTGQYSSLGKQLPPIRRELKPGQNSITITVRGNMHQGPKGGMEPITAKATFSGNDAIMFINDPSYEDIYDDYGLDGDLHVDGDYEIAVASVS
jgi:hypothetical protein